MGDILVISNSAQYRLLKKCLPGWLKAGKPHRLALPEQPLDRQLLRSSLLFRKSRERYLEAGGVFHAALLSSPRSLSSSGLLENRIEYSPIESELLWTLEAGERDLFFNLRTFTTSTFHEQNHRVLWKALPPAPHEAEALRRYLNFAESLIITLDMALGDEFGPTQAAPYYYTGTIYDPGTTVRQEVASKREYRNYLQAALYVTYLHLEMYNAGKIRKAMRVLFPALPEKLLKRVCDRSLRLDRLFVSLTNPSWQEKNLENVRKALSNKHGSTIPTLELPEDPMQNYLQYLFTESWLESFGL